MFNWRSLQTSWLYRLLGIHSPSAHYLDRCWCKGTKREIFRNVTVPIKGGEANARRLTHDEYRRFVESLICEEPTCANVEEHNHRLSTCSVECETCEHLTENA